MIIRSTIIAFSIALLSYALFPDIGILRPVAAGLAIALIFSLTYPYVRAVKKGDGLISVQASAGPLFMLRASTCIAMEDGRKGDRIPITFTDGTLGYGVIEGYAGLITPARIRILRKPNPMQQITVV